MDTSTNGSLHFLQKFTFTLFLLVLIGTIIFLGREVLVPFAFAVLLSVLLLPVNNFLEKKKIPRVFAIIVSLTISLAFIASVVYFLASQITAFMEDIPTIKKQFNLHMRSLQQYIYQQFSLTRNEQTKIIEDAKEQMKGSGPGFVGQTFLSLTHTMAVMVLLPVYSFLILYYRNMIRRFLVEVFKDKHEPKVSEVLKESKTIVQSYMTGLLIETSIVATVNSIGFLVLGIKYAIFLGVIAAILNLIPYIGMLIASILCMAITLTTTSDFTDVIWVGVILTVIQFIDNNVLMPRIVSSKVKINALMTILGVLTGGALAGIPGMFLSIPSIAILKTIFDRVDHLKPWGMLLGDDITKPEESEIYKRISRIRYKTKKKTTTTEKSVQ